MKNNKKELNTLPKFKTLDAVIKKASKSKDFRDAYNEEKLRFRLAIEIKNLRIKQQLTQKTLAEKANMPQSVIARIEGGKHTVSLTTLNKLAHALGKKVSEPFFVTV